MNRGDYKFRLTTSYKNGSLYSVGFYRGHSTRKDLSWTEITTEHTPLPLGRPFPILPVLEKSRTGVRVSRLKTVGLLFANNVQISTSVLYCRDSQMRLGHDPRPRSLLFFLFRERECLELKDHLLYPSIVCPFVFNYISPPLYTVPLLFCIYVISRSSLVKPNPHQSLPERSLQFHSTLRLPVLFFFFRSFVDPFFLVRVVETPDLSSGLTTSKCPFLSVQSLHPFRFSTSRNLRFPFANLKYEIYCLSLLK